MYIQNIKKYIYHYQCHRNLIKHTFSALEPSMSLRPCNEKKRFRFLGFPRHGSLAFSSASSWDATLLGPRYHDQSRYPQPDVQVEKPLKTAMTKEKSTHLQLVVFLLSIECSQQKNPIVFNKGRILLVGQAIEFPKAIKVGQLLPSLKKKKTVFGWQIKEIVMKRLSCDSHTLTVVKILGWLMRESWWNGFLWLPYTYYKLGSISQLFEVELSWLITSQLMGD